MPDKAEKSNVKSRARVTKAICRKKRRFDNSYNLSIISQKSTSQISLLKVAQNYSELGLYSEYDR